MHVKRNFSSNQNHCSTFKQCHWLTCFYEGISCAVIGAVIRKMSCIQFHVAISLNKASQFTNLNSCPVFACIFFCFFFYIKLAAREAFRKDFWMNFEGQNGDMLRPKKCGEKLCLCVSARACLCVVMFACVCVVQEWSQCPGG